ncbi:unnamed protein product, partial [Coregonus sp. 'balchen']
SAFSNNVLVAYDLLTKTGPQRHGGGRPSGHAGPCSSNSPGGGGVSLQRGGCPHLHLSPPAKPAPWDSALQRLQARCAVFFDYIWRAQRLYAEGPAGRALHLAVLGTLHEALETSQSDGGSSDANRYTNT